MLVQGLIDLGLVNGNAEEAVAAGVAGLFMPHGLGHQMGLDVHDMEDLGEDFVGYDDKYKRSKQPGLASLRMGKMLEAGHVLTVEPGIYFIPALIEKWHNEGTCEGFINFAKLKPYYKFGGIRLEDDILITPEGCRLLGSRRLIKQGRYPEREISLWGLWAESQIQQCQNKFSLDQITL